MGQFTDGEALEKLYQQHHRPLVVIDGVVFVTPPECAERDGVGETYSATQRDPTVFSATAKEPTVHSASVKEPTVFSASEKEPTVHSAAEKEPTVFSASAKASTPAGSPLVLGGEDGGGASSRYSCARLKDRAGFRVSGVGARRIGVYHLGVWTPEIKDGVIDYAALLRAAPSP